ncbi:putative integral membrane protein [Brachybacterium faecium]|uniref:Uncharacterized conserved protein n=1 Tax=Brachybacterium faecium (strain ATCC 43885 / DSM 4810 / JCM 11609 / LMG 19847 / NBRC 14762 / NCIMB 9860 / 6-10) TaxID=446465 RepID=C7ME92_BRAFD|nr:acyltransferase [Brachybacterium faecium]ACU85899.1 uncharacterized conserved protein [Brachybacterium faecium DSM 4810]SLM92833.1 putative integral membrane protein [Brachybacterium faecium]HJG51874.1 acyltransferase [Brachybacterium faecium]
MTSGQRTYLPYLDVTRILAVLGVVAIHVVSGGVADGEVGIAVTALDMALKVAVPIFFMMSGALSLDPAAHRHGPGHFLRRRARRIVPALVVWSAFYLIVIEGFVSGNPVGSLTELMDLLVRGKTYTHLYFLFAIAGLYLLSPVLAAFLEQDERRRAWIVGLAASGWTVAVISVGQAGGFAEDSTPPVAAGSLTFFLLYAGYFVLGRALVLTPLPRWCGVVGLATVPGFVALVTWLYIAQPGGPGGPGPVSAWVRAFSPVYGSLPIVVYSVVLMAAVSSLFASWRVPERAVRPLRTLGTATFGIFLVHFAVIVVLREALPALAPYETVPMAITWVLTVLVSALIALIGQRVPGLRLVF